MRRAVSAAVLIAACACAGEAAAQDRPAAYVNAEACLEANVDAAVAASSGAVDAAEFLLTYLCAGPVEAATRYEVNSELLASGRSMAEGFVSTMQAAQTAQAEAEDTPNFDQMSDAEIEAWLDAQEEAAAQAPLPLPEGDVFEGISVDPVTGEIVTGDNQLGPFVVTFIDYLEATARAMSARPPLFLRERAGQLVLARRGR